MTYLYKLNPKGPQMFSKKDLEGKDYINPSHDFYLVYDIQGNAEEEYSNYQWDITQLAAYTHYRGSGLPFAVSMVELMEVKV